MHSYKAMAEIASIRYCYSAVLRKSQKVIEGQSRYLRITDIF